MRHQGVLAGLVLVCTLVIAQAQEPFTIAQVPVGTHGYMVPWSIKRTPDGKLWVLGHVSPSRRGTATMEVLKTRRGVRLPHFWNPHPVPPMERGWVTDIPAYRPDLVPVEAER